jgi:hypothetical protein
MRGRGGGGEGEKRRGEWRKRNDKERKERRERRGGSTWRAAVSSLVLFPYAPYIKGVRKGKGVRIHFPALPREFEFNIEPLSATVKG